MFSRRLFTTKMQAESASGRRKHWFHKEEAKVRKIRQKKKTIKWVESARKGCTGLKRKVKV